VDFMPGVRETGERVQGIEPDLTTRFRWRAERRARKLNEGWRIVPSYRWEAMHADGRWHVVAMQNVAVPK
jgi:hypothetical protein